MVLVSDEVDPFSLKSMKSGGELKNATRHLAAALTVVLYVGALKAEVKPFSVDMYAKSADFGYYNFRGTRTVSYNYPQAGWSIGLMKNGSVCFNVADGTNRSYIAVGAIHTSWREGEWNHVAGSFADNRLVLWVNGEKFTKATHFVERRTVFTTNVCCVASVDSPRAVITDGRDPMTGGRFKGKVADYRFLNRALDDGEVAARAAEVSVLRANDPDAPKMVPDEIGIDVAPPCTPTPVPLTLQPQPQRIDLSDENVLLTEPCTIVLPDGKGLAAIAGEVLQASLARGSGLTATVVTAGADLPACGTHFRFVRDARLGREEYRVEGASADGGYLLTVYGTDRGYVYAADTIRQLVRIRSLANGRRLSLPARVQIADWPLMPHRAALGHWRADRREALGFARARLNDMWVNSLKPGLTADALRRCCAAAQSCGVDVISGFGYRLTKPWTFSDPASMDEYKAHVDMLVDCGVKGIRFVFDDLAGKTAAAWSGNAEMRKRFPTLGAFQNALVHQGLDWVAAHTNFTPTILIAGPSYYSRGWGERGKEYYADFTRGFCARNVLMEHCVFDNDDVARLMADGAETYQYGLNGLWPSQRFFTWFVCPISFRWGWYTWHVDLNGKGPQVNPEAMESIRSIHLRSKMFWAAASGGIPNQQAGVISWNPPAYDPDLCDRATIQAYYGTGAYGPLRVFESALMPIIGSLGAFRTAGSLEWDLRIIPRHVGVSKKELAGYRRNFAAAEAAYAALEKAFAEQRTPFDRPDLGDERKQVLRDMRQTLDGIRKRLRCSDTRQLPNLGLDI